MKNTNYQAKNSQAKDGQKKYNSDHIYTSVDYDKFIFKEGNRNVSLRHVAEIADDMKEFGWKGAPMEVSLTDDGRFHIEEGQHRYEAAKITNTPIRYMVVPAKTVYEVATANCLSSKWTAKNYVEAYSGEKNINYQRLSMLQNQFPMFSLSEIMTVATGFGGGRNSDIFKKGYYRMDEKAFYEARTNLGEMIRIKDALKEISRATKAYFTVIAVLLKHQEIEPDKIHEKITKYGASLLPPISTTSAAIDYIERLYNYHSKGDKVYLVDAYKRHTNGIKK